MASLLDLRVSRVGPAVENNLVELVDMVKQMGRRGGNLTESQNRKMVGYLGNLDEMRSQIVIMVQRYEDDSKVLKRLLELLDRIDDVKDLAITAEESKDKDAPLVDDLEIAAQYDTPFNPLMVSTLNILDVSGLFASKIIPYYDDEDEEEEEEEEDEGDAFWDHVDDPALVAAESEPQEVSAINLSVSNLFLPSLFDSCDNLPTTPPPPLTAAATLHTTTYAPSSLFSSSSSLLPPSSSSSYQKGKPLSLSDMSLPSLFDSSRANIPLPPPLPSAKGKGKGIKGKGSLSISDPNLPALFDSSRAKIPVPPPPPPPSAKGKGKGKDVKGKGKAIRGGREQKGKGKARVTFANISSSEESEKRSESESESESEGSGSEEENGANAPRPSRVLLGWRRTNPSVMPSSSSSSSSSSVPARANTHNGHGTTVESDSGSGSGSGSGSESESESESSGSSSGSSDTAPARRNARAPSAKKAARASRRRRGPCDAPVLCRICYDEYDRWELVHQFAGCEHTYCRDCLRDYLATHITEGAVLDLTCPFPECQTEFPPPDIKFLSTCEIYAKFERFTLLAALRADPNARWCPNPYCNNGIKHDPNTMPWVHCNACKFEFCFHCMAERHDGVACGQEALAYLKKKHESEQAASDQFNEWADLMKALVKPCPGCKAFIEKNDGCNHMTCTNPSCRTQFCWLCLSLYGGDHFMDDVNFPDCYDKQYWTPPDILLQTANLARVEAVIPRTRRFANIAKKVGIYMGVGVAVVTLGVPAAVIGGPVYGCFKLHKRLKARRQATRSRQRRDGSGEAWTPPTRERIAQARDEARRLYLLEHGG